MKKPKIEYRKDRNRWGFRIWIDGNWRKLWQWHTEEEASAALDVMWAKATLPKTNLKRAVAEYILDSNDKRSRHRIEDLWLNLNQRVIPFFGETTDIRDITSESIEKFIHQHKGRVKNITIWHYIKDLRAMLNWCIRKGWLKENPIAKADLTEIRNRRAIKAPLDIPAIDRGIEVLRDREKLYADTLRFMGLRKDEGNHIQAKDVLDYGKDMWLKVCYHQTDIKSNRVIPIPSILHAGYRHYLASAKPDDYILCNDPRERTYSRRRMFEKVSLVAGVKVTPKDLRDYFASVVGDVTIASQMLGHTTLRTTATYVRQVQSRMLEAMEQLSKANMPGSMKNPLVPSLVPLEGEKPMETDAKDDIQPSGIPPKWLN